MKIGFIGLGNVGGKLAGSLARAGFDLTVRDLDQRAVDRLREQGAKSESSTARMAAQCDALITCLPSPAAAAEVMEGEDGALAGLGAGKLWMEMSTTDADEVKRIGAKVAAPRRRSDRLPRFGRLSSRGDRQHFDFRRLRTRGFRARAADFASFGAADFAHRRAWLGVCFESPHQLFGERESGLAGRGVDDGETRANRSQHGIRSDSHLVGKLRSCTKPKAKLF